MNIGKETVEDGAQICNGSLSSRFLGQVSLWSTESGPGSGCLNSKKSNHSERRRHCLKVTLDFLGVIYEEHHSKVY